MQVFFYSSPAKSGVLQCAARFAQQNTGAFYKKQTCSGAIAAKPAPFGAKPHSGRLLFIAFLS